MSTSPVTETPLMAIVVHVTGVFASPAIKAAVCESRARDHSVVEAAAIAGLLYALAVRYP